MLDQNQLRLIDDNVKDILLNVQFGKMTPKEALIREREGVHGIHGSIFNLAKYLTLKDSLTRMGAKVE
jgi:hypothetical protein